MTVDGTNSNEQVIFVTGGYDHTIKIWQPHTGVCQRTCQHTDSVSFRKNLMKHIDILLHYHMSNCLFCLATFTFSSFLCFSIYINLFPLPLFSHLCLALNFWSFDFFSSQINWFSFIVILLLYSISQFSDILSSHWLLLISHY